MAASSEQPASAANLIDLFQEGEQQIERKRTDNLFKQLDERQLTEDEQSIIQKRIDLQRRMFQEYEKREKQRKVRELREVCPTLDEEGAEKALDICKWKEEDAANRLTSDPAFLRKIMGPGAAEPQLQPQGAPKAERVRSNAGKAAPGPRPPLIDPAQVGDGVFVGRFKGRLGPHQLSAIGQQSAPAGGGDAAGAARARGSPAPGKADVAGSGRAAGAVSAHSGKGDKADGGEQEQGAPRSRRLARRGRANVEEEEADTEEEWHSAEDDDDEDDDAVERLNSADVSDGELRYEHDLPILSSPLMTRSMHRRQQEEGAAPADMEGQQAPPQPSLPCARLECSGPDEATAAQDAQAGADEQTSAPAGKRGEAKRRGTRRADDVGSDDADDEGTEEEDSDFEDNPKRRRTGAKTAPAASKRLRRSSAPKEEPLQAPAEPPSTGQRATRSRATAAAETAAAGPPEQQQQPGDAAATTASAAEPTKAAAGPSNPLAGRKLKQAQLRLQPIPKPSPSERQTPKPVATHAAADLPAGTAAPAAAGPSNPANTAAPSAPVPAAAVAAPEREASVDSDATATDEEGPKPAAAKPRKAPAKGKSGRGSGGGGVTGGAAISARGHTCRGRVKQKGVKRADLLAAGKLVAKSGWYNAGYIFPAGFKSQTLFRSSVALDSLTVHTCEILGEDGAYWPAPTFVVTAADRPNDALVAKSCTGCWTGVLKRINSEIEARRAAGEDLPPPPKTAIAGPEYFGLNQPEICKAIEDLDEDHVCAEYWDGKSDRKAVQDGQVVPPREKAAPKAPAAPRPPRTSAGGAAAAGGGASASAPGGGRGKRGRRGSDEHDAEEDTEEAYAGNRWSGVSRMDRYRKRCEDAGDDTSVLDADNPLPGFIDPITLEPVVNPAISPNGHVMGLATWKAVLAEHGRCPFTKQSLTAEQVTVLTKSNIERFKDRIIQQ